MGEPARPVLTSSGYATGERQYPPCPVALQELAEYNVRLEFLEKENDRLRG